MSSSIWTRCAGGSEVKPLSLRAVRVVEAQHRISTRRLVDTLEEQALLEELIDAVKPKLPRAIAGQCLHYLLSTPFRHPPLSYGSRFGKKTEPGIWYGSLTEHTAFCEVAYYRLLFLEGTSAQLSNIQVDLSAFWVGIKTARGVDLTVPPFAAFRRQISSKVSYSHSQRLGSTARGEQVEVFVFASARDARDGRNVALFAPAFVKKSPRSLTTWRCRASRENVEFVGRSEVIPRAFRFERSSFLVRGRLPSPALGD